MNTLKTSLIAIAISTMAITSAHAINVNNIQNSELKSYIEVTEISLAEAKARGLVGEKPDGLLIAVKNSASISALVTSINSKRMEKYQGLAKKHGVSVLAIQRQAGKKLIENMSKGQYYVADDGSIAVK